MYTLRFSRIFRLTIFLSAIFKYNCKVDFEMHVWVNSGKMWLLILFKLFNCNINHPWCTLDWHIWSCTNIDKVNSPTYYISVNIFVIHYQINGKWLIFGHTANNTTCISPILPHIYVLKSVTFIYIILLHTFCLLHAMVYYAIVDYIARHRAYGH